MCAGVAAVHAQARHPVPRPWLGPTSVRAPAPAAQQVSGCHKLASATSHGIPLPQGGPGEIVQARQQCISGGVLGEVPVHKLYVSFACG